MKKKYNTVVVLLFLISFQLIAEVYSRSGVDRLAMDPRVVPSQNFYYYANGTWLKNNPIPPTESAWGTFNILRDKTNLILKSILEDFSVNKGAADSNNQKLGDYYRAAMDSATVEKLGVAPIKNELLRIDAITKYQEIVPIIASLHKKQMGQLFSCYVFQDLKNSTEMITYISQARGGLPDKEYYTKTDSLSEVLRAKYKQHIEKMFLLANYYPEACQAAAKSVLELESVLAQSSMSRLEQRDYTKQYNKMSLSELKKLCPNINWDAYFSAIGLKDVEKVIVSQMDYILFLNKALKSVSIQDWKCYLKWNVINESAYLLSSKMVEEDFYFNQTVLNGTKEMKPRWKKSIDLVNSNMGELLGQAFVQKVFSAEAKKKVNELVDNLTEAFKIRLLKLDWMSDSTKTKALEKLAGFKRKLGYPDKWKDYTGLKVVEGNLYLNTMNAKEFEFKRMINKLGKPVDKSEWNILPQTINANYSPINNEVVFPAAIMQPPFFYAEADDAINYGAIGAVIGHELLHGFDDQGCMFDKDGNMKNWWTADDTEKFKAKTKKLEEQFNNFRAFEDLNVNGKLTMGENIADLGGLTMAYEALQIALKKSDVREIIDSFNPEQRFFLGWAQVWRINMRPEALRQMVKTNVHAPGIFRVLGPLANMQEFYYAFAVHPGDDMYRLDSLRVKIW